MHKLICFLITLFITTPIHAKPVITLGSFLRPPLSNSQHTGMMDQLVKETLRRINLEVRLINLPAQRSLNLANSGEIDGDILRVANMNLKYPNLVPVPEKMMTFEFVVFTRKKRLLSFGWNSLKRYRIGLIKGWKILEVMTAADSMTTRRVLNEQVLFELLAKDQVDVALYERYEGLSLAKEMGITDIHVIDQPLASRPMYLYLHKKHAAHAPKAAKALKEMKREGVYDAIVKETLHKSGL